jgi:hypothetical protein
MLRQKIQSAMTNQHKAIALQATPLRYSQKIFAAAVPVENRRPRADAGATRQFRGEFHPVPAALRRTGGGFSSNLCSTSDFLSGVRLPKPRIN